MNKKVCYLVVGYAPTPQKENTLYELLCKLNSSGNDILLVMHNKPSDYIIDLVNYFVYDPNNEVLNYYPKKGDWFFPRVYNTIELGNPPEVIWTQYSSDLKYHGFAALSMMFQGLGIAKSLGYDICHLVEYDTGVGGLSEFQENEDLLNTNSSVFYFLGPDPSMVYCQIASYNLNHYEMDHFNWKVNKEKIKQIVNSLSYNFNTGMAELAFHDLLHKVGTPIKKTIDNLTTNGINLDLSHKNNLDPTDLVSVTPFNIKHDEDSIVFLHVLYKIKVKDGIRNIKISYCTIDGEHTVERTIQTQGEWFYIEISNLSTLKSISVTVDSVLLKNYDFINNIDKEYFREHSTTTINYKFN
jgi:hypothetical protein